MKSSLESLAIFLVGILSLIIVSFIIWFNLKSNDIDYSNFVKKEKNIIQKSETKEYLLDMENYEDKDAKINEEDNSENVLELDNNKEEHPVSYLQQEFINKVTSELEDAIED